MSRKSIPEEAIIKALTKSRGNISHASKLLGCERKTIYNHIEKNPHLQDEIDNQREVLLDICERELNKLAEAGYFPAIKFLLSTRGQSRGYTTKQSIDIQELRQKVHITYGIKPIDEE